MGLKDDKISNVRMSCYRFLKELPFSLKAKNKNVGGALAELEQDQFIRKDVDKVMVKQGSAWEPVGAAAGAEKDKEGGEGGDKEGSAEGAAGVAGNQD